MRYALIGCGRIAPNHITAATKNHLTIAALCDLDAAKAEAFRKECGLSGDVRIYSDYEALFREVPLDLIAVATSSGDHYKVAMAALKANIHVIVEKPIALSLDEADALIKEARERHLKLAVNHQNRFNPTIQCMAEAIRKEQLGQLMYGSCTIRWYRGKDYYDQANWRGTFEQDGGALMNQCIHNIDLLRWMLSYDPNGPKTNYLEESEIEEVFGYTANYDHPYIPVEDLGMALVKFKNGRLGKIEGTVDVYPNGLEETLAMFGTEGTIMAGGMSVNQMEVWNVKGQEHQVEAIRRQCNENPENVYGNGHVPLYRDMIYAIEHDAQPLVDGIEGRKALEMVLAIYLSNKTGKAIKLPLQHVSTLDFI